MSDPGQKPRLDRRDFLKVGRLGQFETLTIRPLGPK
jgi:hypothetical protein